MRHLFLKFLLIVALSSGGGVACRTISYNKKAQTAEALFKRALKLKKDRYYREALLVLDKLKTRYLYSPYFKSASLMVADIYFLQRQWLKAYSAYNSFSKLNRDHPEIDRVFFRKALCAFEDLPTAADRDLSGAKKVLSLFRKHITLFPLSAYKAQSKYYVSRVRGLLAQREWMVASFHIKAHRPRSALAYLQTLVREFSSVLRVKKKPQTLKGELDSEGFLDNDIEGYTTMTNAFFLVKLPSLKEVKKMLKSVQNQLAKKKRV